MASIEALERRLGHRFCDPGLLRRALTHGSAGGPAASNERLEFLGDRVLGLVLAELLYECFPDEREGELGRRFAVLASAENLAGLAENLGLGELLTVQGGVAGGAGRATIVADAIEAVFAALYLDAGPVKSRALLRDLLRPGVLAGGAGAPTNPKNALQEWAAARRLTPPLYEIVSREGPDHAPRFRVAVSIAARGRAEAEGASKQAAEREAAALLLRQLESKS